MKTSWLLLSTLVFANGSPIVPSSPYREDAAIPKAPENVFIEKPIREDSPTRPEVQFKQVRYGPYKVPSKSMVAGTWQYNMEKPCEECFITAMEADLQYEDGKSAHIDDGAWLHHFILYNGLGILPTSKKDLVCSNTLGSFMGGYPHRIFASGNERGGVRLNSNHLYGMQVDKGDMFHLLSDILNQSQQNHTYFIALVSRQLN
jgi:hypothetical protein